MAKTVKIFEDGYKPLAEKEQYPKCKISPDNKNILIVTVDDIFMGARCVIEYVIKNGKVVNQKVVYNKTDQPVPKYTNSFILAEYESIMYQLYGSNNDTDEDEDNTEVYTKEVEEPPVTRRVKKFEDINYNIEEEEQTPLKKYESPDYPENDNTSAVKVYESSSKYCPICGHVLDNNSIFCNECIRRLRYILYPERVGEYNIL